jgi:hypothetical protein
VYRLPPGAEHQLVISEWYGDPGCPAREREVAYGDKLEQVRQVIPTGFVRRPPEKGDPPNVVETWLPEGDI